MQLCRKLEMRKVWSSVDIHMIVVNVHLLECFLCFALPRKGDLGSDHTMMLLMLDHHE